MCIDGRKPDAPEVVRRPADRHPFQFSAAASMTSSPPKILTESARRPDEAAWASVHGLATLYLDGPLAAADAGRRHLITERLLDVIEEGIR